MFACIYGQTVSEGTSLRDFAYEFSPLVEEVAVDTAVIDVAGCELLFGSAYGLANEIANRAAKAKEAGGLECKVNVALAAFPDAAIFAARFFKGITFISPGEELTCLGELPIEELRPKSEVPNRKSKTKESTLNKKTLDVGHWTLDCSEIEEILETLRVWGVRTFRDFAALPMTGVSERLGQAGVKLQQLASGKTERHLKLTQAAPRFENSIELDHPITLLEPLSFLLARLLNQICANLHAYALATNELNLYLKLENGSAHKRQLNLPHPMRDPRVFLRLLLLDAETHPPQSSILAITINCAPVKPRLLQSGLFIPLTPEPEKLELTLARLVKLVGAKNVGSVELSDTHRPDAFCVKRFVVNPTERKKRPRINSRVSTSHHLRILNGKSVPIMAFRVFRPPLRALVQTTQGFPTEISAWRGNQSVHGKVIHVAGPWRTTGDWWRSDRWARDEWDVAVESRSVLTSSGQKVQALYRIYRELRDGFWFVEGAYD